MRSGNTCFILGLKFKIWVIYIRIIYQNWVTQILFYHFVWCNCRIEIFVSYPTCNAVRRTLFIIDWLLVPCLCAFKSIICSLMSIIKKQDLTIWLWEIKSVKYCEIINPELLITFLYIILYFLCFLFMLCMRIFNRKLDSESNVAYQQWNNWFRRHCKGSESQILPTCF